jgi:catechol 2,3-dioxygenase-like lactoylglutathione lyase family enzyme
MTSNLTSRLNAIGLVAADLPRTVAFYRALGCDLGDPEAESHLACDLGGFRLMIDTEDTMRSFDPDWQGSGSGRVTLAVECASPVDVDRLHDELSALGSGSHLAPFDAFWGQRYATVLDPDGIRVDLYAALPATNAS